MTLLLLLKVLGWAWLAVTLLFAAAVGNAWRRGRREEREKREAEEHRQAGRRAFARMFGEDTLEAWEADPREEPPC